VRRKVYPVASPKVEYSLTALGRTLIEPLNGLCRWTEKHLPELEANRRVAQLADDRKRQPALQAR
jgi:DNA-binding HxlR family transcriptional regulator